jgi:flagellar biogenesis protein FliO
MLDSVAVVDTVYVAQNSPVTEGMVIMLGFFALIGWGCYLLYKLIHNGDLEVKG